ncbi:hypothetical protein NPIL_81551 [Nephila pilipes]|uniref:Uncharacterized protein n=1 Tax=Nephila pilipes TaxID=299642 RepID=A0A8X6N3N3_NEPPI|nr:hypothetical protein NPIL_81551 [Nephila pilipes]
MSGGVDAKTTGGLRSERCAVTSSSKNPDDLCSFWAASSPSIEWIRRSRHSGCALLSNQKAPDRKHQPFHWNHANSSRLPANSSGEQ